LEFGACFLLLNGLEYNALSLLEKLQEEQEKTQKGIFTSHRTIALPRIKQRERE
jgi:hypothetical protein